MFEVHRSLNLDVVKIDLEVMFEFKCLLVNSAVVQTSARWFRSLQFNFRPDQKICQALALIGSLSRYNTAL